MTAIASIYTPDGFVIGADGRRLNPDRTIESDENIKIAEYSAANLRAVGAWSGNLTFDGRNSRFDVKAETFEIAESLREQEFPTLADYAGTIAWSLFVSFREWLEHSGGIIHPDLTEVARMLLLGYVADSPQAASIYLLADRGVLTEPVLRETVDPRSPDLDVFSGKEALRDSLCASGGVRPCSSLDEAERLIRTYIEACAGAAVEGDNSIGGHIHIAAATPNGLRWLVPPRRL